MWIIGDGPSLMKGGFNFICLGEPVMMMGSNLNQIARRMREGTPAAPGRRASPRTLMAASEFDCEPWTAAALGCALADRGWLGGCADLGASRGFC